MKIISDDQLELSTGKKVYAHALTIGLCLRKGTIEPVSYGYDGGVYWPMPKWWDEKAKAEASSFYLTDTEMKELASFMADKWAAFRDSL